MRKRIKNVKIGTMKQNSQSLKKHHLEKLLKRQISESFSRDLNSQWGLGFYIFPEHFQVLYYCDESHNDRIRNMSEK